MASSIFGSSVVAGPGLGAALQVPSDAPGDIRPAASVDVPSFEPRPVWLFVDFEIFKRASGLAGRRLQSAWCRWWVLAESRDGLRGTLDHPKISLVLEVTSRPPCDYALRGDSMPASEFAGGDSAGGSFSESRGPGSRSDQLWLYFDFELYRRASGLRGYELQSSWARWWVRAERRGEIHATRSATIGLVLEELGDRESGDMLANAALVVLDTRVSVPRWANRGRGRPGARAAG